MLMDLGRCSPNPDSSPHADMTAPPKQPPAEVCMLRACQGWRQAGSWCSWLCLSRRWLRPHCLPGAAALAARGRGVCPASLCSGRRLSYPYRAWLRKWEKKALWLQGAYEQTHVHPCVRDWGKLLSLQSWFPQQKATATYSLLWLHQTWHFKSPLAAPFYYYFLFYSLSWALFWICFKMNAAFTPITGSSPAFLSVAAFSLHLALARQLSLSQVGWRHFYSSSTQLRISGSWFFDYLNVNSIHLIVQIGMSLANPRAFQLTSVSRFFALVINVRIHFWSRLLKGGQNYFYFYSRVLSGFKPRQPTVSYTRTTQQCC